MGSGASGSGTGRHPTGRDDAAEGAPPRQQEQPDDGNRGITGSPGTSLHAKTFAIDRRRIFVGSFNFDPRSAMLNTEMGLIESPVREETMLLIRMVPSLRQLQ